MSVSCWIKTAGFTKPHQVIAAGGNNKSWRLQRRVSSNTLAFICVGVEGVNGTIPVDDNVWHHIVGVYDGQKLLLYMDGQLDASKDASGEIIEGDGVLYIGENPEWPMCSFQGLIDDVAIYNHALSAEDIAAMRAADANTELKKLKKTPAEADATAASQGEESAVTFIEGRIGEIEGWYDSNPGKSAETAFKYPSPYLKRAKVKGQSGDPAAEIAEAYKESVLEPAATRPNSVEGLVWLKKNMPAAEYAAFVRQNFGANDASVHNCARASAFEISGDWDTFKIFLDEMFSVVSNKSACARSAAKGLRPGGIWAARYRDYCRLRMDIPEYVLEDMENEAQEHIAAARFQAAGQVYGNMATKCGSASERAGYELKKLRCILKEGRYADAVTEADAFIQRNAAITTLLGEAAVIKGHALMLQRNLVGAKAVFDEAQSSYTGSGAAARFMSGYCYMLEGNNAEARTRLEGVIADYPESTYASRARMYLKILPEQPE
jgi:tetratricopeptide (TPR) repeat protein